MKTNTFLSLILIVLIYSCNSDPSLKKPFFKAVKKSKINEVERLLAEGEDINQKTDEKQLTALHIAVRQYNKLDMIEFLIKKGADVNAVNIDGNTPVHWVTKANIKPDEIFKLLVKSGADINIKNNNGETAWDMMWVESKSFFNSHEEKLLLEFLNNGYKLSPELSDKKGINWLHRISKKCDNKGYIKILVEDFKFDINIPDINGWTALHYAVLGKNYEIAAELIAFGANVNVQTTRNLKEIKHKGSVTGYKYSMGLTPLDFEAITSFTRGDKDMKSLLIKHGAKKGNEIQN